MRKLVLFAMSSLFMLSFVSCDKNDNSIEKSLALPSESATFLSTYFNNISVLNVASSGDSYVVNLSNGAEITFNKAGQWSNVDGKTTALPYAFLNTLPSGIIDYVAQNYPDTGTRSTTTNQSIVGVGKNNEKSQYDVKLSNNEALAFNWEGTFIGGNANTTGLPQNAQTFLTTYFPNASIVKFEKDNDSYDVKLNNGFEVEFDLEGVWNEIDGNYQTLPVEFLATLPTGIVSYISENHANQSVIDIDKDSEKNGYEVKLSNGVELIFEWNGTFRGSNNNTNIGSNLPSAAQEFIKTHYPTATIVKVEKDHDSYDVDLNNGVEIEFDLSGVWNEVDGNYQTLPTSFLSTLPAGITSYVAQNFTNRTITGIDKDSEKNGYEVELDNDVDLIFEWDGTIRGGNNGGNGNIGSNLPSAAQDFIKTHYPTATIVKVEKDHDSYDVDLNNGVEIEFDLSGVWNEVDGNYQTLPTSFLSTLPTGITSYVAQNYTNRTITGIDKDSEKNGYEVELNNDVDLVFEWDGTIRGGNNGGNGNIGSNLPTAAQDFIKTHFPNASIVKSERDDDSYDVDLNNGFEIEFDLSGVWNEVDGNYQALPTSFLSTLPAGITSYVAQNYTNRKITGIDKDSEKNGYEVELDNDVDLIFEWDGTIRGGNNGGNGNIGSNLPSAAQDFIKTHFPNASIVKSERDDDSYDVDLNNGFEIEFDLSGVWNEVDGNYNSLPASFLATLPAGITTYVSQKYSNRSIIGIDKDREENGYEVKLSNDLDLIFEWNGTFRRIDY